MSAFTNGPNHQGLATTHIPSSKHFAHIGEVSPLVVRGRFGVSAGVFLNAKRVKDAGHRIHKTHGKQDQIGFEGFFATRHLLHFSVFPLNFNGLQTFDLTAFTQKGFGGNRKHPITTLFMAGTCSELQGPIGPGQGAVFFRGGLWHHLELRDRQSAVTVARAHTIAARITATNDDHVFAVGTQL